MQSDAKLLDCFRPAADNQESRRSRKGIVHNLECVAHGSQPVARPRSEVLVKAGRSERVLRLLELLHLKEPRTHTPLLTPLAYRRCRACGSTITLSSKLWPSIGYWTCGGAFGCCFLQNSGLSQLTGTCQLDLRCRFKRNPRQNFHYFKAPTICMGTSKFGKRLFRGMSRQSRQAGSSWLAHV